MSPRPPADYSPPPRPVVVFVSLPAGLGGSARSLVTVLAHLAPGVHRVVACRPGSRFAATIRSRRLADEVLNLQAGTGRGARRRVARLADGVRLARWGFARRHQVAAVHANGLAEALLAWPLARAAAAPLVVWAHEWEVSRAIRTLGPLLRCGGALRWATVSEAARAALVASGVPGSTAVAVIPNPIDPADLLRGPDVPGETRTTPTPDPDVPADSSRPPVEIAYLGAPAAYKGFDLLPDLIEHLAHQPVPVRWRIWSGPRTQEPATWARLTRLEGPAVVLEDKVDDVGRAYAQADVVVCPSRHESFGRVAAEAMASGCPVVVSDLPALREVVGSAGVLVPPGDVEATADALAALASDPARRHHLGTVGRQRARAWAPGAVTAALRATYGIDRPRVLVVSHEATRTGAPAVAVEVARALATFAQVEVVLRWPGPLAAAFARTGAHLTTEPNRHLRVLLRRQRWTAAAATRLEQWAAGRVLDRSRAQLVWANTVLSACYLDPARARDIPAVLHVHELGRLVPGALRRYGAGALPAGVTVVAASRAAAEAARPLLPVGARLEVLPSPIDVDDVVRRAEGAQRATLDGPGTPLVVGCGAATHRKGIDRWIEIAARVHRVDPTVRFRWVGLDAPRMAAEVRARGLAGVVELVDEVEDPLPHLAAATVFTLPSRHDTFPLVVLEAMALARPVVAFDAGGMAEQLGSTGVLVPADDVEAFADATVDLLADPIRRASLGAAAARRVRTFDRSVFADAVTSLARELLAQG